MVGGLIASVSVSLFQVPYNLAAGGVSGIGIIVAYFTGLSRSLFYLIANIPLLHPWLLCTGRLAFPVSHDDRAW